MGRATRERIIVTVLVLVLGFFIFYMVGLGNFGFITDTITEAFS